MSTQHQRTTYFDLLASGQAITQAEATERYLARAGMASTKQVSAFLAVPDSTATRVLDTLSGQGKVVKAETPKGRTAWRYVPDASQWPALARRYQVEKVRRNIDRVIRSSQEAGNILPSNLIDRLKLAGNDLKRVDA